MKYWLLVFLLAGLVVAVVVADLARSAGLPPGPATRPWVDLSSAGLEEDEAPLLLEDAEPLLLLEEGDASQPADNSGADNSRCHVCHMNYERDLMASAHARGDIGCENCHGESVRHCSDEDNITPPDRMYPGPRINASCHSQCHVNLTPEHQPFLEGRTIEKFCTDCHDFIGHRLAYRTRRWDKDTGELIWSDNVRMSVDAMR